MTCEQLVTYLSSYIDHELDEELTQEAQQHLATCPSCRVVLQTTQRVIVLGREQGRRTIPAAERGALFARLQAAFLRRPAQDT